MDQFGKSNPNWRGGRVLRNRKKYWGIHLPAHPRSDQQGYVLEHILIAETALGKPLPILAVVHHVNEDGKDNSRGNHVICQDDGYHRLIHRRARAFSACAHANWLRCSYCKTWDNPSLMVLIREKTGNRFYGFHRLCRNLSWDKWRERKAKRGEVL